MYIIQPSIRATQSGKKNRYYDNNWYDVYEIKVVISLEKGYKVASEKLHYYKK